MQGRAQHTTAKGARQANGKNAALDAGTDAAKTRVHKWQLSWMATTARRCRLVGHRAANQAPRDWDGWHPWPIHMHTSRAGELVLPSLCGTKVPIFIATMGCCSSQAGASLFNHAKGTPRGGLAAQ